ncbi:MAG: YgaP family membrane protein [Crocinitomicaceae bacterium]|jgi:hypothetical protein
MKHNIGNTDRLVRIGIAVLLLLCGLLVSLSQTWNIVFMLLAAYLTLTSFVSFCPVYLPLGINTSKRKT